MMTQLKTVSMFSTTSSFIIYGSKEHPQLALPKQIFSLVSEHKITINELISCYREFILSAGINDDLIEHCSASMFNSYLLPDYPVLPTIVRIGALDRPNFTRLLKSRKVFQLTNFS